MISVLCPIVRVGSNRHLTISMHFYCMALSMSEVLLEKIKHFASLKVCKSKVYPSFIVSSFDVINRSKNNFTKYIIDKL